MVDLSYDVDDVDPREKIMRRQVGPSNSEEALGKYLLDPKVMKKALESTYWIQRL